MPKTKPQYQQKFRQKWLDNPLFKNWLMSIESTSGLLAKCKVCHNLLTTRYADLKNHGVSKKHKDNEKLLLGSSAQPKIPFKKNSELLAAKEAEGRLSLFIARHTSINVCDHLIAVCKESFTKSSDIQMHRTKCAAIIKNLWGPYFVNDLKSDVGDSKYSLIIDESTDITVNKYLGLVIIYFSKLHKKIVTSYLDLAFVTICDSDGLIEAMKTSLQSYNLNLQNLMGIGTDNASVMVGVNNGLYTKLKAEVPNLILIPCVCHSIQLAVSHAAKEFLPRNLEFLIQETYNWFSKSTLRQASYKQIYNLLNDGHDPLKIVQSCQTRWLSIETAVSRIFDQWLELKTHFSVARLNEKCYTAQILYEMFDDDRNYIYLAFLKPVLNDLQRVNKLFEGSDVDPTKLLQDLNLLLDSLVKKITAGRHIDVFKIDKIDDYVDRHSYLGYLFEKKVKEMHSERPDFNENEEFMMRQRCIKFIICLIGQIKARLPQNIQILQKMSLLSVQNILKQQKEKLTELLKYFDKSDAAIAKIESQYDTINLIQWKNLNNTREFWYEVYAYRNAFNENPFEELVRFALEILTLPHSNAEVERLFSVMNIVKNKVRNRLQLPMLKSILNVRAGLKRYSKCCNDFNLPAAVVAKIKTNETYANDDNDVIDFLVED